MKKKVALVHNWLTTRGGSENVLFELSRIYPDAPIYTLVYNADLFPELANRTIKTSWLQYIPWLRWHHELFPPLRYLIWKNTILRDFDLVITSSSSENKAVRTPGALHIAYVHTPPHYYWRYMDEYLQHPGFGKLDPLARLALKLLIPLLKSFDRRSAQNPDALLANSKFVQNQISNYYDRESVVLYPLVDTVRFNVTNASTKNYYLAFGRQTVFKHFDIVIQAFNELGLRLKVAGTGSEHMNLKKIAESNVELLGYVSDSELARLVSEAKACVFGNEEDFGITWVESMAAGVPVICFGSGGALETVIDGKTGILFGEQTPQSIVNAVYRAERTTWDKEAIKAQSQNFSSTRFREDLLRIIEYLEMNNA